MQQITLRLWQACLAHGDQLRTAQSGKTGCGGHCCCRYTKQRNKQALPGTIVLIWRVPDGSSLAQMADHGTYIFALNGNSVSIVTLAATTLHIIKQRIFMRPIHAINGVLLPQQRRADFQGGEVNRHQNDALPIPAGLLQVFQPFNVRQLL